MYFKEEGNPAFPTGHFDGFEAEVADATSEPVRPADNGPVAKRPRSIFDARA
jgi:hypothetical protein